MANLISGFRISERLLERVHTLTEHLAQVDHIAIITQVSRSVVMRIALLEGLVSWEANYGLEGGVLTCPTSLYHLQC